MVEQWLSSFDFTIDYVRRSVSDLTSEQMVTQPPHVPNHGSWTLGHLIFSCHALVVELGGMPWLPDEWESSYGYGSKPLGDACYYPSPMTLLDMLNEGAQRLRATITEFPASTWARPHPDQQFPTLGHLIMHVVVGHSAYHAGQLALWRRAIGMPSVGVFV